MKLSLQFGLDFDFWISNLWMLSYSVLLPEQGDPLTVKVNKLSSTKTQLPYDYYYLNYCKPPKIVNSAENLGEVLRGDRIENSVYTVRLYLHFFYGFNLLYLYFCVSLIVGVYFQFQMLEEEPCKVACRKVLDAESAKNFKEKIDDEYRVNM